MSRRFDNWPELLAAFLVQHAETPFEWGRFDCALFACDAIYVMTGMDPGEPFRLQYDSALGAARKMSAYGGAGGGLEEVAEKVSAEHGFAEIPVLYARRGDAVLFDSEHGATLGIVGMEGTHAVAPAEKGLQFVPVALCRRAWRVG